MVPCTQLQHPNQIVKNRIRVCHRTITRLLRYQVMCKNAMAVENGLQVAIGSFSTTWLSGREIAERIMGMSITGQPIVNRDFPYIYRHLKRNHIARKNTAFAQNPVVFTTPDVYQLLTVDPRCRNIINALDIIVQPTPVWDLINNLNETHICFLLCIYT